MNQDQNGKLNIWTVLAILFVIGAMICIGVFVKIQVDQSKKATDQSDLVKFVEPTEKPQTGEQKGGEASSGEASGDATDTSSEPEVTPEPLDPFDESVKLIEDAGVEVPNLEVDIASLQETENPDIYAWIYIPGTKVNYPVLQHPTDDTHYLNYNLDGSKGYPGCIYSEKTYNGKDFWDANTVLYGHNMKNGTMFGSLHKYEDEEFFYNNRYIYVYTKDRLFAYKIFAAYDYTNEHLLYNTDFEDDYSFCRFFLMAKDSRGIHHIFDDDVELTGEEHIITLSTCINGKPNNRFLVQGVLINEEEY